MKILFLRQQFSHMGRHSGYDLLFTELSKNYETKSFWFSKGSRFFLLERLWLFIKYNFIKIRTPFYSHFSIVPELKIVIYCLFNPREEKIIHVGYLEDNYGLLAKGWIKSHLKNTKIIATTHQPASWWRLHAKTDIVGRLDGLIVLSEVEKRMFEVALPQKVYFLPHGVDHSFFCPDSNLDKLTFRCMFSGQWLRDIPLLIEVVETLILKDSTICFDIVYPKNVRDRKDLFKIAKYNQVCWHADLTDNNLKKLYQNASVLLMPLLDCTANNAILEGLASGLPIVTNEIEALHNYLPYTDNYMIADNYSENMVRTILSIKDKKINSSLNNRNHVEQNLTWEKLSQKCLKIYEDI